jgi:hypothetical protein
MTIKNRIPAILCLHQWYALINAGKEYAEMTKKHTGMKNKRREAALIQK